MTEPIVISRRFCGPPDSGNGGYTCGVVAARVDGPAVVTLRRPPPLDTPVAVVDGDDGSVRVLDGDDLVAGATRREEDLAIDIPEPVGIDEAAAAGTASHLRLHPEEHPFPTCFVCGPQRTPGDGMRIIVGPVVGREVAADVWTPAVDLADTNGAVRPEFVWAALDCSGGIGSFGEDLADSNPYVLVRFAARIAGPVRAGAPYAVVGWRIGLDGRKLTAGSAIFTDDGELVGLGRATWIQLAG